MMEPTPEIRAIMRRAHSPIRNYVVPGVTSWLLGERDEAGHLQRLLTCEREQHEFVTPHSHRFDFATTVLQGTMWNRLWTTVDRGGDTYGMTTLAYAGRVGGYEQYRPPIARCWQSEESAINEGASYAMRADAIHSVRFARGTVILIDEGPPVAATSVILEPVVDGETLPTFRVEPWMFRALAPGEGTR